MADKINTWWGQTGEKLAKSLVEAGRYAEGEDKARLSRYRIDTQLYFNRPIPNLDALRFSEETDPSKNAETVRITLAKSAVDTVHAKIVRNMPRTVPLTERGTYSMQKAAQRMETFIEGVKYRNDWDVTAMKCVRASLMRGDDLVQIHGRIDMKGKEKIGRIIIDRVFPWELFVDPLEAYYGEPRSLFRITLIDRHVAASTWRDHADEIVAKGTASKRTNANRDRLADQVCVVEGWRLPSGCETGDGKHAICIEGVDSPVFEGEWKRDNFGFAKLAYTAPDPGYWGRSIIEEISGIHAEANDAAMKRQAIMAQTGRPIVIHGFGDDFEMVLDNDLGIPVYKIPEGADANDVRLFNPPGLTPETMNAPEMHVSLGLRMIGVSELSASSLKPAGLDSGVALREHQDIETERFAQFGKALEQWDRKVSTLIIETAKELHDQGVKIEVSKATRKRRKHVIEKIKWADVNLDEGAYELQTFPSSQLPRSPAGRLAMVEQLIAGGFLGREDGLRLLDFPDVDAVLSQELAPYNLALDVIDIIMEEGRLIPPIPEMNLALSRKVTQMAILRFTIDEAPPERITMLRTYVKQIDQLQERAENAAMAQQQGAFVPQAAGQLQAGLPQGAVPDGQAAPAAA